MVGVRGTARGALVGILVVLGAVLLFAGFALDLVADELVGLVLLGAAWAVAATGRPEE